jgi:hypothetical protein
MASPSVAYRNSAGSSTGKNPSPFDLIARVKASTLHPRLRNTLESMLRFNVFALAGTGNELYPGAKTVGIEGGIAEKTVRRHIAKLVALKVLVQVYRENSLVKPGEFRRPATYQLNPAVLTPRTTYKEYAAKRYRSHGATPIRPQSVKPEQAALSPLPALTPRAPKPSRDKSPKLTTRQRKELVQRIPRYMKGCHGSVGTPDGGRRYIQQGDADYRAPMSKMEAILEACKSMCKTDGVSLDRALEAAAEAGFTIETKGDA